MAENRRISPSAMKLVFNGALLGPDTKPIAEIQNLANNSRATLRYSNFGKSKLSILKFDGLQFKIHN